MSDASLYPIPPDPRRLPLGWVTQFHSKYETWFYVNTNVDPPLSVWEHPSDQPDHLHVNTSGPGNGVEGALKSASTPQTSSSSWSGTTSTRTSSGSGSRVDTTGSNSPVPYPSVLQSPPGLTGTTTSRSNVARSKPTTKSSNSYSYHQQQRQLQAQTPTPPQLITGLPIAISDQPSPSQLPQQQLQQQLQLHPETSQIVGTSANGEVIDQTGVYYSQQPIPTSQGISYQQPQTYHMPFETQHQQYHEQTQPLYDQSPRQCKNLGASINTGRSRSHDGADYDGGGGGGGVGDLSTAALLGAGGAGLIGGGLVMNGYELPIPPHEVYEALYDYPQHLLLQDCSPTHVDHGRLYEAGNGPA